MIRSLAILALLAVVPLSPLYAGASTILQHDHDHYPLKHGKRYLMWSERALPLVLNNKSGKPVMTLSEQGLFFHEKRLCWWEYNGKPTTTLNESTVFDSTSCPSDIPVIATYGDYGVGTSVIYIRIDHNTPTQIITHFRGETLILPQSEHSPFSIYTHDKNVHPM